MLFDNYSDIVTVDMITQMLGIGKSSVYALLQSNQIRHVKIGKKYIVPKRAVIDFIDKTCYTADTIINGR